MKSHLGAVDPKQNKTKVSLLLWPLCWHPPQTPATAVHLCCSRTATSEVCVVLTCLRVSCHQQTWGQCLTPVMALPLCRFSGLSWLLDRAGENYVTAVHGRLRVNLYLPQASGPQLDIFSCSSSSSPPLKSSCHPCSESDCYPQSTAM